MDPRRGMQHEYGRSRGAEGGGYGALASFSGRAIPPKAVPSLSTGQGFYTVESLQGATVVPPPQPAPPPPRFLPPPEPYPRELPPPRLPPAQRGDLGPFDRRYPPPPAAGRKMMMMPPPPPELPYPRRGEGMRGPGMPPHHHPPPPFIGDPRMPGFHPGWREAPSRGPWPPSHFERHAFDHVHDRGRPSQRIKAKKQGQMTAKPVSQVKSLSNAANADKKSSPTNKRNSGEGGPGWCAVCKINCLRADSLSKHIAGKRHKKQLESQMQAEKSSEKAEELKEESASLPTASKEAVGKAINTQGDERDETITGKEGDTDHKSAEDMAVDAPKGEDKSGTTESKPIVGKKRVLKNTAAPNKKIRKSAASSDAPDATTATAAKEAGDANNSNVVLDAHVEGADHASCLQTPATSLQSKGDIKEPPTSEKKPVEEICKDSEDGSKEVRDVTDLEHGRAGQSAEIQ